MLTWFRAHPLVTGLLGGVLAFLLSYGGWHLLLDHATLHLTAQQVGAWQAAVQAQQPPAAPSAPK